MTHSTATRNYVHRPLEDGPPAKKARTTLLPEKHWLYDDQIYTTARHYSEKAGFHGECAVAERFRDNLKAVPAARRVLLVDAHPNSIPDTWKRGRMDFVRGGGGERIALDCIGCLRALGFGRGHTPSRASSVSPGPGRPSRSVGMRSLRSATARVQWQTPPKRVWGRCSSAIAVLSTPHDGGRP